MLLFLSNMTMMMMLIVLVYLTENTCQTTTDARAKNVTTGCVNNTCAKTYADVYSYLGSQQNYFNIARALYPAKKPSSVLVHVKLHGSNGTENWTQATYTWSMSCLYAAIPSRVLEILSLGSILVTHRTEKLHITIPPFCCNVQMKERSTIIKRVVAELQDLAVMPQLQDPTLNTAECVTKGYEPNIAATERSLYIIMMISISCAFTLCFGPLWALITLLFFNKETIIEEEVEKEKQKAMAKALKSVGVFMLVVELSLCFTVIGLSINDADTWVIPVILGIILIEGVLLRVCCRKRFPFLPEGSTCTCCTCCTLFLQLGVFVWANLTTYHFCWLVIGIMINPLSGSIVLLVVFLFLAASVFIAYNYFSVAPDCHNFILSLVVWLSLVFIVGLVMLAGQSFFGQQTSGEVVRAVVLSVASVILSWMIHKLTGAPFGVVMETAV